MGRGGGGERIVKSTWSILIFWVEIILFLQTVSKNLENRLKIYVIGIFMIFGQIYRKTLTKGVWMFLGLKLNFSIGQYGPKSGTIKTHNIVCLLMETFPAIKIYRECFWSYNLIKPLTYVHRMIVIMNFVSKWLHT